MSCGAMLKYHHEPIRLMMYNSKLWSYIIEHIGKQKSKIQVLRKMLELGIRVGEDGRFYAGDVELTDMAIAKSAGVDRRVVRSTARIILEDPELRGIFTKLRPVANLSRVAPSLGFTAIQITADADRPGIIAEVSGILAKHSIVIRQLLADDPELYKQPKLTIIIEGELPGEVVEELHRSKKVRSIALLK